MVVQKLLSFTFPIFLGYFHGGYFRCPRNDVLRFILSYYSVHVEENPSVFYESLGASYDRFTLTIFQRAKNKFKSTSFFLTG